LKNQYLAKSGGSYVLSAEIEKRIPGTKRTADVLLVERSVATGYTKGLVAVEVFHTHEVDQGKLSDCIKAGVKVVEVTADCVMQAMTRHGDYSSCSANVVTLSSRCLKHGVCDECVLLAAFSDDLNGQLYHWTCYDEECRCFYNMLRWKTYDSMITSTKRRKSREEADWSLEPKRLAVENV
jgi:hypothetical protein